MILNTGSRTDIPAFYSDWFYNRIQEGYCLVRNPYYPEQVTKYVLSPQVIDAIVFCTKNPQPMLDRLSLLSQYCTFWLVTITPYEQDIEPCVPRWSKVIDNFRYLSRQVGVDRMSWRYDPIFISQKYSVSYHIERFEQMAEDLQGYTRQCVVSFIDLYEKTKRNFPQARSVTAAQQEQLIEAFSKIAAAKGMQIHLCCEDRALTRANVDADGCLSQTVLERAIGSALHVPKKKMARDACSCLLGADIGMYNTCGHGCLYCYANYDNESVRVNRKLHDPASPLLIGHLHETDIIKEAEQKLWQDGQLSFFQMGF
jgi:hypothetical protein